MSVAIILKNTILVILIILIGHFMVKNYLLDRHVKSSIKSLAKETKPNTDVGGALVPIKTELALSPIVPENETPIAKPSSDAMGTIQGGLDKAKEELLKFIDDDEEDNVDRYFSKDTTLPPQPTDNCKVKVDDSLLPLSSTCDQAIQSMPRNDMVAKTNTTTTTHSPQKNVVFLKEYENESTMNGGELFGGLTAFDAFDNNFQTFYDV